MAGPFHCLARNVFVWHVLGSFWYLVTNACGILIHNEVTYRALGAFEPVLGEEHVTYKAILTSSKEYLQAGSFFPDWGYNCLGYHEESEDAHWAPFVRAAVDYVRETYPIPHDDPESKGLIAFIFGMLSHGVADVRWHNMHGLTSYVIEAMAQLDFANDYPAAHEAADTGAEAVLQHFSQLDYQRNITWKVPVRDLVHIYERLYSNPEYKTVGMKHRVPRENHLSYCMTVGFMGSRMDLQFGRYMFGHYGPKSPFLVQELNDYYKGGLQDMATSVVDCFPTLITAFQRGSSHVRDFCGTYYDDKHSRTGFRRSTPFIPKTHKNLPTWDGYDYDLETGILTLSTPPNDKLHHTPRNSQPAGMPVTSRRQLSSFTDSHQNVFVIDGLREPQCLVLDTSNRKLAHTDDEDTLTLSLPVPSAAVGHASTIGDFNADGRPELAISAPYDGQQGMVSKGGAVYILDTAMDTHTSDIRSRAQANLTGDQHRGRFGWSMATVDLNADGIDDLAVAAPFAHDNAGYIDIYFGRAGRGLPAQRDMRIRVPSTVAYTVEGLGAHLAALDIDGDGHKDLVIGCPYCSVQRNLQAGAVFIFLSSVRHDAQSQSVFRTPDYTLWSSSPKQYEHFGRALTLAESTRTLLISAPDYNTPDARRAGRIYAFALQSSRIPVLEWTMTGTEPFQQFGATLAFHEGQQLLAVASPTEETRRGLQRHWQAGAVRVYDWAQLGIPSGTRDRSPEDSLINQLSGQADAGHLGSSLTFFEDDSANLGLWVGEPMADEERGRVYRWSLAHDDVQCIRNEPLSARFGSHVQMVGSTELCVAAEYESSGARFSGAIHLVNTQELS
ncbi:hypothetical protein BCR43DRAFT_559784 [Syncephalastrum racemosum]|uniref:Phosphatidylinositol-glycan-specific phospholipase D n=1 Tax=Syncephalastrum racemosum TaxID=13706 RepID=A0A1X2HTP1_SYNRA|nr:hypothetical protein BCR43DRAFT_559784 [Syncephalastrum racemosum]